MHINTYKCIRISFPFATTVFAYHMRDLIVRLFPSKNNKIFATSSLYTFERVG